MVDGYNVMTLKFLPGDAASKRELMKVATDEHFFFYAGAICERASIAAQARLIPPPLCVILVDVSRSAERWNDVNF